MNLSEIVIMLGYKVNSCGNNVSAVKVAAVDFTVREKDAHIL